MEYMGHWMHTVAHGPNEVVTAQHILPTCSSCGSGDTSNGVEHSRAT